MTEAGYMTITGAGDGIMHAAQHGAGAEKSFGLNILLPFEQHPNEVIRNDPKLDHLPLFLHAQTHLPARSQRRRRLSRAASAPWTKRMEVITLMQTGKARLIPLVLIDEPGGKFWKNFVHYVSEHLMADKLISPEDFNLFKLTDSVTEARNEILRFYHNFHSYRFVGPYIVIRLQRELSEKKLDHLRKEFLSIFDPPGEMFQRDALPQEADETEIAAFAAAVPDLQPHPFWIPAAADRPAQPGRVELFLFA